MKVAHVLPWVSRNAGGLFNSVSGLAKAEAALQGMVVEVFASRDEFSDADLQQWSPLTVHTVPVIGPARLSYTPALRGRIERFAPDLVHSAAVWTWQAALVNQVHARKGVPYVLSTRGTLDAWAMRHSHWKKAIALRLFQRRHFERAACIHALNESEARSIRAFGLNNPIAIIPNGISLPEIGNAETLKTEKLKSNGGGVLNDERLKGEALTQIEGGELKGEARATGSNFSISACQHVSVSTLAASGRKVLLFLGRIHPKKGLVNLLKAWAEIQKAESRKQKGEDWVLAIAGWDEGGHEAELKRLCDELGLAWRDVRNAEMLKTEKLKAKGAGSVLRNAETLESDKLSAEGAGSDFSISACQHFNIFFLGPLFGRDKEAAYRACDAFILPSYSEGLPMAVLEAWSYAKPVLMTPECNLPEGFAVGAAICVEQNAEMLKSETLKSGEHATFNAGSGMSIEAGLRELCSMSDDLRLEMGTRGRRLVEERFAWPQIARAMKAVYEWVLGGGAPPPQILKS